MNKISKKELFIMGGVILLAFVVFVSFIYINFFRSEPQVIEVEVPSAIPYSSGQIIPEPSISNIPTPEPVKIDSALVEALIKKLPYEGENFTLSYDKTSNIFIYLYQKSSLEDSRAELQQFLEQNGFKDRKMLDAYGFHEYFY